MEKRKNGWEKDEKKWWEDPDAGEITSGTGTVTTTIITNTGWEENLGEGWTTYTITQLECRVRRSVTKNFTLQKLSLLLLHSPLFQLFIFHVLSLFSNSLGLRINWKRSKSEWIAHSFWSTSWYEESTCFSRELSERREKGERTERVNERSSKWNSSSPDLLHFLTYLFWRWSFSCLLLSHSSFYLSSTHPVTVNGCRH